MIDEEFVIPGPHLRQGCVSPRGEPLEPRAHAIPPLAGPNQGNVAADSPKEVAPCTNNTRIDFRFRHVGAIDKQPLPEASHGRPAQRLRGKRALEREWQRSARMVPAVHTALLQILRTLDVSLPQ